MGKFKDLDTEKKEKRVKAISNNAALYKKSVNVLKKSAKTKTMSLSGTKKELIERWEKKADFYRLSAKMAKSVRLQLIYNAKKEVILDIIEEFSIFQGE